MISLHTFWLEEFDIGLAAVDLFLNSAGIVHDSRFRYSARSS